MNNRNKLSDKDKKRILAKNKILSSKISIGIKYGKMIPINEVKYEAKPVSGNHSIVEGYSIRTACNSFKTGQVGLVIDNKTKEIVGELLRPNLLSSRRRCNIPASAFHYCRSYQEVQEIITKLYNYKAGYNVYPKDMKELKLAELFKRKNLKNKNLSKKIYKRPASVLPLQSEFTVTQTKKPSESLAIPISTQSQNSLYENLDTNSLGALNSEIFKFHNSHPYPIIDPVHPLYQQENFIHNSLFVPDDKADNNKELNKLEKLKELPREVDNLFGLSQAIPLQSYSIFTAIPEQNVELDLNELKKLARDADNLFGQPKTIPLQNHSIFTAIPQNKEEVSPHQWKKIKL